MNGLSLEDKRFLYLVEEGINLADGHYHVPLPLRNPDAEFPNNKTQVPNWLNYLGRRFVRVGKFFADYRAFIEDMISKGYAKQSKNPAPVGRSWYISHHGVYHPNKERSPGKIRVMTMS